MTLKMNDCMPNNESQELIKSAAKALKVGNLVIFPTETVYGLGANAESKGAVDRIYKTKGRPNDHPLIVHISNIDKLDYWIEKFPDWAISLGKIFWPGPLTLVGQRSNNAKNFITGNQETVAVRIPSHPIAIELLSQFEFIGGKGVVAPSANRFGKVSPTSMVSATKQLGELLNKKSDYILDGGTCEVGIESTIIDCTGSTPIILRPGIVSAEMIFEAIGKSCDFSLNSKIRVSGQFKTHYAPAAKIIINGEAQPGDGFLALDEIKTPQGSIRIASPKSFSEFAQILYESMRLTDEKGIRRLVVSIPEGKGLILAIRDRLTRAAG